MLRSVSRLSRLVGLALLAIMVLVPLGHLHHDHGKVPEHHGEHLAEKQYAGPSLTRGCQDPSHHHQGFAAEKHFCSTCQSGFSALLLPCPGTAPLVSPTLAELHVESGAQLQLPSHDPHVPRGPPAV